MPHFTLFEWVLIGLAGFLLLCGIYYEVKARYNEKKREKLTPKA